MTQDELKALVGQAAAAEVAKLPAGSVIGVGTGSTVNRFIEALAALPAGHVAAAVSSSDASTARLQELFSRMRRDDQMDASTERLLAERYA